MNQFRVFDVRCGGVVSMHRLRERAEQKAAIEPSLWAVAAPGQDIRLKAFVPSGEITELERLKFGDYAAVD